MLRIVCAASVELIKRNNIIKPFLINEIIKNNCPTALI
jgi:hypothetical protein